MTKSTAMASTTKQMVKDMKVNGRMENSMEQASISFKMDLLNPAYGKMERELNGLDFYK